MTKKLLLAALAVSGLAATTAAQSAEDSGFYIGAGIGRATLESFLGENNQGQRFYLDDWDTAWRAIVGYQLNKYVAFQVEYIDTGTQQQHLTGGIGFALDAQTTNIVPNVMGILPINDTFSVYGKVGYAFYDAQFQLVERRRVLVAPDTFIVQEFGRFREKESGEDLLYGAGVRVTRDAFTFDLQYEIVDVDFETIGDDWDFNILSLSATYQF